MAESKLLAANRYRGRFAPSPTGPLHFGSLLAALASYLDARTQGGQWLLRIEDVDAPRNVPGAAEEIVRALEAFGFEWDGDVVWQSRRLGRYADALEKLKKLDLVYPCVCSRKEIADRATRQAIDGSFVYPGSCRDRSLPPSKQHAWRMQVPPDDTSFEDRIQGTVNQNLASDVGDFVLLRADGQYAYQLAVVVDDAEQGITDVVRGADLIDSTTRQIWLQRCLQLPTPRYAHIPVATNAAGEKLSKQTRAPALDCKRPSPPLYQALRFLDQSPPAWLAQAPTREIWQWAFCHWSLDRIPRLRGLPQRD